MTDAERQRLAALRATPAEAVPAAMRVRRMQEGQVWELPELLGHELRAALNVTRCSSQDRGADANSDLIIATSSLEVGFDDPEVGAVLHHKRPGSMSSFIQRKGRAGRTRGARPWTVTVLSDYGADRWAFHSAERLFQPEVESLHLPLFNPFVLRVQLASFLVDWIGTQLGGSESAFRILQGPATFASAVRAQERTRDLLRGLLEGGQTWREFEDELTRFFRRGSGLPEETASQHLDSLLWHEPRPLLLRVIPTVLRKLEAAWRYTYPPAGATHEDAAARRPLPQFIPQATFSELEIGEAALEFEPYRKRARDAETLSVSQLLFETCPGRVSKRFATVPSEPGYWHPHSNRLVAGENVAPVAALFPRHTFLEAVAGVSIVQPEAASVVHRPAKISDGSNATWQWKTLVRPLGEGTALPVRDATPWRAVFSEARAFLHSNAEWLEVLRYAGECQFELRRDRESVPGTLALQSAAPDGATREEAIGFRMSVDGVRFVLHAGHLASRPPVPEPMLARFRPDWFAHRLAHAPALRGLVNSFQAEWLAQLSLAMLTATALRHHGSLPAAREALAGRRSDAARKVLDVIFQMRGANPAGADEQARLRITLLELWETAAVQTEILRLEQCLWAEPDAEMMAWVRQRYATTLAQALRAAMIAMVPQVSEGDLTVDVLAREDAGWDLLVTELSPGGLGQVETIVREMQRQPRRFLDALEHALEFCPREQTAGDVLAVAARACAGGDLAAAFEQTRSAVGFSEMETARETLEATLQGGGFAAGRGLMVALMNKLLRPASSPESDQLIFRLNRGWRRRSARLQVAIPLRTFAYACAQHQRVGDWVQRALQRVGGEAPTAPQRYAQLQQLLLEGCADSCPECLGQRGRYYELGSPSRALAVAWLDLEIETLTLDSGPGDWAERAREILRRRGRVRLVAKPAQQAILVGALPALVVTELELAELRVPVAIGRIERRGDRLAVVLHVPDFIHG